jgi:hypothetical protein
MNMEERQYWCGIYLRFEAGNFVYVGLTERLNRRHDEHEKAGHPAEAIRMAINFGTEKEHRNMERDLIQRLEMAGFKVRNKIGRLRPATPTAAQLVAVENIQRTLRYNMRRTCTSWSIEALAAINMLAVKAGHLTVPYAELRLLPLGSGGSLPAVRAFRKAGRASLKSCGDLAIEAAMAADGRLSQAQLTQHKILERFDKTNRYRNECLWIDPACQSALEQAGELVDLLLGKPTQEEQHAYS